MHNIFEEIRRLHVEWYTFLGRSPWESNASIPHAEGWCLNGYGTINLDEVCRKDFKNVFIRHGRVCWITPKMGLKDFRNDAEALNFVVERYDETRSPLYGLPLQAHNLNDILKKAWHIR